MRLDRILLFSMSVWASVALGVGLASFVLKGFIREYGITDPYLLGILSSSTFIGMFIGAATSGLIGDRFGRKNSLILYVTIHIVSNVLLFISGHIFVFTLLRVLAGIGAGGILPILSTLVAEYSTPKDRGARVAFLDSAWAYGWLVMVLLAAIVYEAGGWRSYALLGSYTAALLSLPAFLLPESPRYLLSIGERERAVRLARRYGVELPEIPSVKLGLLEGVKVLLSREHRRVTILLWITWFSITMGYYGIFIWFPKLLASRGLELGYAAVSEFIRKNYYSYLVLVTFFQIPGYYSALYLVEKVGRVKTLSIYLILTGLASFALSQAVTVKMFLLAGFALNFFDLGAWAALYVYTPEQYPTQVRVLGSSWAAAWGRVGSIIGPYLVPFLGSWTTVFSFFAIINIVGGIAAIGGRELKGREMIEMEKKEVG